MEVRGYHPPMDEPEPKLALQDALLSQFVGETAAETSLARDLLQGSVVEDWIEGSGWELESALESYAALYGCQKNEEAADSVVTVHDHRKDDDADLSSESCGTTENSRVMTTARAHVQRGLNGWSLETPTYTFTLPDFSSFPDNFRRFLEKDLIETSTLKALENSGHLNWWIPAAGPRKLWPLATSGDGNCLLHSASLGMWGFHDRLLILRKALYEILAKGSRRHALWRRWRWQQNAVNRESGLEYSEREWREEWEALVRLASPQPRSKPASADPISHLPNTPAHDDSSDEGERVWESLEEIHVFALAHVLKRPVLVVADTVLRDSGGEAFAPIPFGGIYLPLECPPAECHRSPLVLSYDAAHFSALVLMQESKPELGAPPAIIPITSDKARRLLPLHFAADPGPDFTWWADEADQRIARNATLSEDQRLDLITRYLDIMKLPARRTSHFRDFARPSPTASPLHGRPSPSPRKERRLSLTRLASSIKKKMTRAREVPTPTAPKENEEPKRRFSFSGKKLTPEERGRSLGRPKTVVSVYDLRDTNWIVGARLNTQAHHQYMTEMMSLQQKHVNKRLLKDEERIGLEVDNYLKAARVRFDVEAKTLAGLGAGGRSAPRTRERISRSLSATTMEAGLTCINGACAQPASHATNFLCPACFSSQRTLMASFSGASPNHPLPTPPPTTMSKSHTLPLPSDTSIGVRAVTHSSGVTRYFPAHTATAFCRSPHCRSYSNGHPDLCPLCASRS